MTEHPLVRSRVAVTRLAHGCLISRAGRLNRIETLESQRADAHGVALASLRNLDDCLCNQGRQRIVPVARIARCQGDFVSFAHLLDLLRTED